MTRLEPDTPLRAARRRGEMARRKIRDLSKRMQSRGSGTAHVEDLAAALDEILAQAAEMSEAPSSACRGHRAQWRQKAIAAALMMAALTGLGVAMTSYADSVRLKFVPRLAVVSSCTG